MLYLFFFAYRVKYLYICTRMAADKDLIEQKYTDIRKEFDIWKNKTYNNIQKYSELFILIKISEKFYLSPRTIENIVYHRIKFENPKSTSQGSLFN